MQAGKSSGKNLSKDWEDLMARYGQFRTNQTVNKDVVIEKSVGSSWPPKTMRKMRSS